MSMNQLSTLLKTLTGPSHFKTYVIIYSLSCLDLIFKCKRAKQMNITSGADRLKKA